MPVNNMKRHCLLPLVATTLAVLAPVCALAQEVAETDIVVTGKRSLEEAAVRDAVHAMTNERSFDRPLVRFHDPVCFFVSGLGEAGDAQVRARLLANAQTAGIPVAEEGCRANALLLVVDDPKTLVEQMAEQQPKLIPSAERRRLEAALGRHEPVLVWHNEELRGSAGENVRTSSTAPGMPVAGPSAQLGAETPINSHARARRVGATHSRAIVSGVIILDIGHLVGMDLQRVADYATMRLLAPSMGAMPVSGDGAIGHEPDGPRSILTPFAAEQGDERLTRFDRAWLSALYDLAPNASSRRLAGAVARVYARGDD